MWTYVYFSHGKAAKRSVGFVRYNVDGQNNRVVMNVQHQQINQVKFVLGGQSFGSPGFNGQFVAVTLRVGAGAFIDGEDQLNAFIKTQVNPVVPFDRTVVFNQISDPANIVPGVGAEEFKPIGGGENAFPSEYSVSGWFKWTGTF